MGLRTLAGIALALSGLTTLAAGPALADCDSDMALYDSIRQQFNALPACANSGAEQAVKLGLMQQGLEVTRRFEASCPNVSAYTPSATFQSWIDGFNSENKETCATLEMMEGLDEDLQDFQDAAAALAEEHRKEAERYSDKAKLYRMFADGLGKVEPLKAAGDAASLRKAAGILRDMARAAGEAGEDMMRQSFEQQAADAEKEAANKSNKPAARADKESCKRVASHVEALRKNAETDPAIAGQVAALDAQLKQLGCQ